MNTEELTQVVTAHQSAISRHEQWFAEHQQAIEQINAAIAANVHANEVQRERFDAEIVNLATALSNYAASTDAAQQRTEESIQRLDTTLERFINTLDERFRSNGQSH